MLASENLNNIVIDNMEQSLNAEISFFNQYLLLLKQYPALSSRFHRLSRTLSRDPRIIMKSDFLPTLNEDLQKEYYNLLILNQMREKDELLDCVSEISCASDPMKEAKKWNQLPWLILRCVLRVGYSICNDANGYDAYEPGNLDYACHFSSLSFSKMYVDCYAVTSLCPHIKNNGYWYHSFNLSNDQTTVYDVSNGFLMDVISFQDMLEPIILDSTLGSNIEFRQNLLLSSNSSFYQEYAENCPLKGFAFQNYDQFSFLEQENLKQKLLIK